MIKLTIFSLLVMLLVSCTYNKYQSPEWQRRIRVMEANTSQMACVVDGETLVLLYQANLQAMGVDDKEFIYERTAQFQKRIPELQKTCIKKP